MRYDGQGKFDVDYGYPEEEDGEGDDGCEGGEGGDGDGEEE